MLDITDFSHMVEHAATSFFLLMKTQHQSPPDIPDLNALFNEIESPNVRRPPNSFILYRRDKQTEILNRLSNGVGGSSDNREASRIIGEMWKKESEQVKNLYKQRAALIRTAHARQYPHYQYFKRKRSENSPYRHPLKISTAPSKYNEVSPLGYITPVSTPTYTPMWSQVTEMIGTREPLSTVVEQEEEFRLEDWLNES